jgi:hypothetical protein
VTHCSPSDLLESLNDVQLPSGVLALRSDKAAFALQISERTLWTWTQEGIVPHVQIGKVVLFPVDVLRAWLRDQAAPKKESES